MISIDNLLNIVATEAVESEQEYRINNITCTNKEKYLPPIRYDLELIKRIDGSFYWIE